MKSKDLDTGEKGETGAPVDLESGDKQPYTTPTLTRVGSLANVTLDTFSGGGVPAGGLPASG